MRKRISFFKNKEGKGIFVFGFVFLFILTGNVFAEPRAFPVPYLEQEHASLGIKFTDLPGEGTIKIFTVKGDEIISLSIAAGDTIKTWDVTNQEGEKVGTGVYLYLIEAAGQEITGKLVVIR